LGEKVELALGFNSLVLIAVIIIWVQKKTEASQELESTNTANSILKALGKL